MFVVIEGIDGCGKGTQVDLLAQHLAKAFRQVTTLKYPDRTSPIGKLIDQWLHGTMALGTNPDSVYGLMNPALPLDQALANQALLLANKIEVQHHLLHAFECGHVVADRYTPSGIAYGAADGLDFDYLYDHHHMPLFQPDLYILLDMPVAESFTRRPVREEAYEANVERVARARDFYLKLADLPAEQDRWLVLDGTKSKNTLHTQIADAVEYLYEVSV
jgi:dTMP kinase